MTVVLSSKKKFKNVDVLLTQFSYANFIPEKEQMKRQSTV